MAVNTDVIGKTYPPASYAVGREKIREYARAVGESNPLYLDVDAAREQGYDDVVAPPMFAVVYALPAVAGALPLAPTGSHQLRPQRRHAGEHGRALARHRLHHLARQQIVERVGRTAGDPDGEQAVLTIVERQRQDAQRAVVGGQPDETPHRFGRQHQIAVGEHHPLGPPGRARGVEDLRHGVLRARRQRQRVAARQSVLLHHRRVGVVAGLQRRQTGRVADQQPGPAVGQDVRHLRTFQQRIDRHADQPRARGGERQQAGDPRLGQPARHPVALGQPARQQSTGKRAHRHFHRRPGQRKAPTGERQPILHQPGAQMVQRSEGG